MSSWNDNARTGAQTSNKIAGMSDDARTELARQLNAATDDTAASYRRSDAPMRREPAPRDRSGRRSESADPEAVTQLAASLHRTERRLKMSGETVSPARKTRLTSRAKRLKRQLRRTS